MKKENRAVYFDIEESQPQDCAIGVIITNKDGEAVAAIPAGKAYSVLTKKDEEEKTYQILASSYGVSFFFEGSLPSLELYPVPMLELFAADDNGCFGSTNPNADICAEDAPIYYVGKDLSCRYLATNLYDFLRLVIFVPDWRKRFNIKEIPLPTVSDEDKAYLLKTLHLEEDDSIPTAEQQECPVIYKCVEQAKADLDFAILPERDK